MPTARSGLSLPCPAFSSTSCRKVTPRHTPATAVSMLQTEQETESLLSTMPLI